MSNFTSKLEARISAHNCFAECFDYSSDGMDAVEWIDNVLQCSDENFFDLYYDEKQTEFDNAYYDALKDIREFIMTESLVDYFDAMNQMNRVSKS